MKNVLLNKINFHCDMIWKGKPCSCEAIQDRLIKEAMHIISKRKLKSHVEYLAEGWSTIWVYKDDYMLEIIKELPDEPKTIFEHWVLGKAFGYSDESIREFIFNHRR